jgi:hypothetical protein
MTDKLKDEYIYIVSGHMAGGTSMTMRVMEFGGFECVYNKKITGNGFLNNPYGVFEGGVYLRDNNGSVIPLEEERINFLKGKVFKMLGAAWTKTMPTGTKVKVIRISREPEERVKAILRRKVRRYNAGVITDKSKIKVDKIREIVYKMHKLFEEGYTKRTNCERLDIKFEDMLKNPEKECKRIAEFVSPREFDWKKASTAVDKTLNHGEGFDYKGII